MIDHLKLEVREGETGPTILLAGELDLASAPELRALAEPPLDEGRPVLLDLRGLTFIDSTGLGAIAGLDRRAREAGTSLTLVPGPSSVQRVFDVSGTLGAFDWLELPPD